MSGLDIFLVCLGFFVVGLLGLLWNVYRDEAKMQQRRSRQFEDEGKFDYTEGGEG